MRFNKAYWLILCVSIILFSKLSVLFSFLGDIAKISGKIELYEGIEVGKSLNFLLVLLSFARFTFLPLAIYLWGKKILKEHPQFEGLICFYTILGVGVWFSPVIFDRFPNYITPLYFISLTNIIIPSFLKTATLSRKLAAIVFICIILIVYGSYPIRIYKRYVPYYSVFNPHSVERVKQF